MKNTILNGGLTSFGGMKPQTFQTLVRAWKVASLAVVAGTLALTGNASAADTVYTVTNGQTDLTTKTDYFTVVVTGGVSFNTPNTSASASLGPLIDILFGGVTNNTNNPTTAVLPLNVVDQNSFPNYSPAILTVNTSGNIGSVNDTDPSLAPITITDTGTAAAVLTIGGGTTSLTTADGVTGAAGADLIFVATGSQLAFTPFTAPGTVGNPLSLLLNPTGATPATGNLDVNGTLSISTGVTLAALDTVAFTGVGTGTTTISGNIAGTAGTGALSINAGTVILSGANTFGGGTTLNGGTLDFNSATALGTGTFTINGGTIDNTSGAALTDTANNPITINGSFTFTGSNNLNLGTGAVTELGGSSYIIVKANTLIIGGAITGAGLFLGKNGPGTLALTNSTPDTLGGIALYGGTLDVGNGGTTGSITGTGELFTSNATLSYTVNAGAPTTTTLTGGYEIVSAQNFVNSVNATDTLALGVISTFSAVNDGGLVDYQPLTTDLGAITTSTDTATAGTSAATSILATNESIGSGTTLAYAQSGTAGTNAITAYTAAAAFPVTGGTAAFNYKLATNGTTTLTAAESANTLQFTGTAAQTVAATVPADTLTVNGLMNSGTGGVTITAPIIIGANDQLVIISNASNTTISSVISQGALASLVYGGVSPGTLTLTGTNTYTGGTLLNGGTLSIGGAAGGLIQPLGVTNGTTTGVLTVGTSSTLTTDGAFSYTLANPISLQSPFATVATTLTVNVPLATSLTLTGLISGSGGIIVNATGGGGSGTLILSSASFNFYSGPTSVQFGTLQAGSAGGFSSNSDFSLLSPATLDLNGFSETISSLSGVAGTAVTNNNGSAGLNPSTLTIGGGSGVAPAVSTFSGNLTNGLTNTLALVLNSGGTTLILNGAASTYSGGTTITNGALAVGSLSALGTGFVSNNSTLETTATTTPGSAAQKIAVGGAYSQTGTLLLQVVTNEGVAPQTQASAGVNYDTLAALGTVGSTLVNGALTTATTVAIKLNFEAAALPGQRFQVASSASTPLASLAAPTLPLAVTTTGNINPLIIPITSYNDSFNGTFAANNITVTLFQPYTTFAGLTANQTSVATNLDNLAGKLFGFNFVTGVNGINAPYATANGVVNTNGSPLLLPPVGTPVRDFFDNITEGVSLAAAQGNVGHALDELSPQRFEVLHNVAFDNYAFDIQSLDNEFARERMGFGGVDTSGFTFNNSQLGPELSQVQSRLLAWSPAPEPGLLSDSSQSVLGGVAMADRKDMKEMAPMAPENPWNVFIDGGVDLGDKSGNSDLEHSSYTTGRVRLGADYRVCTDLRVGALFGYNHTDADLDNEGSKAHVDSYTPGIFLTYADKDGFYADGLFTYTANEYDTSRNIIIPGVNRTASGSSSGNQFAGDLDGGYDFHRGDWTFGPSAGLTYVNLGIDSFTETGAGAANLAVNSQSTDSLRSRLGVTVSYRTEIGSVVLTPYASAYWQHEFLDNGTNITSSFVGLPGGTFAVQTTAGDNDSGLFGAGLNAELNQTVTLFIDYGAEAGGSSFFGQSASGGVKLSF